MPLRKLKSQPTKYKLGGKEKLGALSVWELSVSRGEGNQANLIFNRMSIGICSVSLYVYSNLRYKTLLITMDLFATLLITMDRVLKERNLHGLDRKYLFFFFCDFEPFLKRGTGQTEFKRGK
jgi:hypothetical protein